MADKEQTTGAAGTQGQADTPTEQKLSPKNKKSRGIDPSLVTTWVPFDQSKELRTTLANAAAHRGTKATDLLAELLQRAVQADTSIAEDAAKYTPAVKTTTTGGKKLDEMSEEELKAYQEKQEKLAQGAVSRAEQAAAAAKALLAKARERAAAKQAA